MNLRFILMKHGRLLCMKRDLGTMDKSTLTAILYRLRSVRTVHTVERKVATAYRC